ncbi:exported hypothetical protein [Vibrio coralliirubri]|nr:exported hypothetical protein [Vibrio coralliirubri]
MMQGTLIVLSTASLLTTMLTFLAMVTLIMQIQTGTGIITQAMAQMETAPITVMVDKQE